MPKIIGEKEVDFNALTASLKHGGVIVYPTDTAYALGCDAANEEAVGKIFRTKGRVAEKTLSLIVADMEMAEEWAVFSPKARELANRHWPGPLTLALPCVHKDLPSGVVQDGFIALRVPDNAIARGISARLGKPIIATSANASGQSPCYTIEEVKQSLSASLQQVDYIIDAGELPRSGVSTIVKVISDNIEILRPGAIVLP